MTTVTQAVTPMTNLLDEHIAVPALVRAVLVSPPEENKCWPVVGAGLVVVPSVGPFVGIFVGDFVGETVGELVGACVGGFVGVVDGGAVGELVGGVVVGELVDGVIVGEDVGLAEGGGGPTFPSVLSSPAGAAGVDAGISADDPC